MVSGQVGVRDGGRAAPTGRRCWGWVRRSGGWETWRNPSAIGRAPTRSFGAGTIPLRRRPSRFGSASPTARTSATAPPRPGGGRAARLVDEFELAPLAGWVALIRAGGSADPAEAEQLAGEALESARRFADADLELCALSQMGSSLVTMGRVAEGIELLDEAMAGSLGGEGGSLNTVVFTSCQMMISQPRRRVRARRRVDPRRRRFHRALRMPIPLHGLPHPLRRGLVLHGPLGAGRGGAHGRPGGCRRPPSAHSAARPWPSWPSCAWPRGASRRRSVWSRASRTTPPPPSRSEPSTSRVASRGRPRRFCADARAARGAEPRERRAAGAAGRGRGRPGRDRRGRRQSQPARRAGRRPRLRRDRRPGRACPGRVLTAAGDAVAAKLHLERASRRSAGSRCRSRRVAPASSSRPCSAMPTATSRSRRPAALSPPSRIWAPPITRTRRRRSCARWG